MLLRVSPSILLWIFMFASAGALVALVLMLARLSRGNKAIRLEIGLLAMSGVIAIVCAFSLLLTIIEKLNLL